MEKEITNDKNYENQEQWSHEFLAFTHALHVLKKEFSENDAQKEQTKTDIALGQLAEKVSLVSDFESHTFEQLLQRHPELTLLMQRIVHKINQKNTTEWIDADVLQNEKELLLDLWYSIIASLNKQNDEEIVKWDIQEGMTFFKKIPIINWIYKYLADKALA